MMGTSYRKETTILTNMSNAEEFEAFRCIHQKHQGPDHGRPEGFPLRFNALLAEKIWDEVKHRPARARDQVPVIDEPEEMEAGQRIHAPEMAACWDQVERWEETARWQWNKIEHNNVLEARAASIAVADILKDGSTWGHKILAFSDSQVVIGFLSKGRSSRRLLNYIARRTAAMLLASGTRLYWRYVRTFRNHADAPSRQRPFPSEPEPWPLKVARLPFEAFVTEDGPCEAPS
jgi:hypothetical protein